MSFLLASNSANGQPPITTVRSSFVGHAANAAVGADVGLEAAVHRQAAVVGVVAAQQSRLVVVLAGPHGLRDAGVPAICPDDHAGAFGDGRAVAPMPANADHATVLEDDVGDGEAFSDLGSRFGCCVDEQLVQHRPSGAVGDGSIGGSWLPGDREGAEIERVGVDRRASRCREPVEQSPSSQRRYPRRVDLVRGDRVAGK